MLKKMLIDAAHPEETRVAIIDNHQKLIDYDFESTTKKTLKGNIYLAKIARVEPSLQAAFVDYGGERHGFLAFSEIHPDYFKIPVSDRAALEKKIQEQGLDLDESDAAHDDVHIEEETLSQQQDNEKEHHPEANDEDDAQIATVEGEFDVMDEASKFENKQPSLHRLYKIQEVIKKNQIVLIQVTKEERGGKGAALTTYISMAGRYCVLMPNSPNSGGISRKISNPKDRKRLREILDSLETPETMGLIIRTAGMERTKTEIKRDAEYLMRLWNEIRISTLESIAPCLIYQEDDIIKRAIRDLYSKDVEEILVEGEEGYKTAKSFMKNLMPSHSKRIKLYKNESVPLFFKIGIEKQIDEMHSPTVRLPSGGSIVLHPTEALVSIDINSGRATKERHIEETALKTNLEAADEICRQIRLRDLAGLIVIDFIDMDNSKNIAAVERRVREIFRNDRARVQIGKISPFGLLELSRQRLKPSILETTSVPCPHCHATGFIRSKESMVLMIMRLIEEEGYFKKSKRLLVRLPVEVAFYILNHKRSELTEIEKRHKMQAFIESDASILIPNYIMTRLEEGEEKKLVSIPGEIEPSPPSGVQKLIPISKNERRRRKRKRKDDHQQHPHIKETKSPETESSSQKLEGSGVQPKNEETPASNEPESGSQPQKNERRSKSSWRRQRYMRRNKKNQGGQQQNATSSQTTQSQSQDSSPATQETKNTILERTSSTSVSSLIAQEIQENASMKEPTEPSSGKKKTRGNWWKRLIE
jgi:ribonuclease E